MVEQTFVPQWPQADQLLCAILREEPLSQSQFEALMATPDLLAVLEMHGVTSLIYHKLHHHHEVRPESADRWAALSQYARRLRRKPAAEQALQPILGDLAINDVYPLL